MDNTPKRMTEEEEIFQMMALLESTVKKKGKQKLPKEIKPKVKKSPVIKKDVTYLCELCKRSFKSRNAVLSHMRKHSNKHSCADCGKQFTQKSKLITHLEIHSEERKYICEFCGQSFRQRSCLRRHRQGHMPAVCTCKVCGKQESHPSRLALHMRMHEERKFQCDVCGKLFTQKPHLNTHMLIHTGQKKFQCSHCDKQFTHKSTLIAHTAVHTGQKPFECEYCGKKFTQRGGLKSHVDTHLGIKKHKCDVCGRGFTQKGALNIHSYIHSGRKFECRECGKQFKHKSTLKGHVMNQHDMKEGGRKSTGTILSHDLCIKVHTGPESISVDNNVTGIVKCKTEPVFDDDVDDDDPNFSCGKCGSSHKTLIGLSEHMEKHNVMPDHFIRTVDEGIINENAAGTNTAVSIPKKNLKIYECDKCDKRFSYKSTLATHQKVVHSDEKQFKCPECPKEFARKSYLDVHMVVHTGERKYKCDECGKSFTQKGSLNAHSMTHREDSPCLKCTDCGAVFSKSCELCTHKREQHDVKIELQQNKYLTVSDEMMEDLCILVEIEPLGDESCQVLS